MGATPPLRMLKGLASAAMEASPDHCSSARNFVPRNGRLQVRPGMRFVESVADLTTETTQKLIATDSSTGAGSVGTSVSDASGGAYLFVGFSSRPYQFFIDYDVSTMIGYNTDELSTAAQTLSQMSFAIWNGSAWVDVGVGDLFQPSPGSPLPFLPPAYSPGGTGALGGLIDPLATWVSSSIGTPSTAAFWLRIATPQRDLSSSVASIAGSGAIRSSSAEHRVKSRLHFVSRTGGKYAFTVSQTASGSFLRYYLNGAQCSVGDSLQPDGTATPFSPGQIVTSRYHKDSDRIIGCIDGFGWFYMVPSEAVAYALVADDIAEGTEYQGLVDGLRSSIPTGPCMEIYDGRVWVANSNTVYYSAPGVFTDIWSNGWEISLGDGGGPITGMCVVGGVLAVFKRNTIYIIQSAGGNDAYAAVQIPGNVGCVSPRGVAAADNVAWFPAEDGIYTFNGAELSKVTNNIDEYWNKVIEPLAMEQSIGVISTGFEEYRLFHPDGTAPWVCPSAVYASFREQDESFWPQAPDADGYGFQATAACVDQTTSRERILIGDRYGCVWQADIGRYDGPQRVTAEIVSSRINVGTGTKATLRWVTPTVDSETNQSVSVTAYADDRRADAQVSGFSAAGDNAAALYLDGTEIATGSETVPYSFDLQAIASMSFEVKGRFFRVASEASCPFTMDATEIEFNLAGRRG